MLTEITVMKKILRFYKYFLAMGFWKLYRPNVSILCSCFKGIKDLRFQWTNINRLRHISALLKML